MTRAPETRKTHVVRIAFTNKAGEILPDQWIDVERIDVTKDVVPGADSDYQGLVRRFRWMDDPGSDDYDPNGNPARTTELVKVCSPDEEDVNDPEEWAPVHVIKQFKTVASDQNYQGRLERQLNSELVESRRVKTRRIIHRDTNIDNDADAAFASGVSSYVVPGDQYEKVDGTEDESQYVEHEIILYLKQGGNYHYASDGADRNQGRQTKLLNQYMIDDSESAQFDVVGDNGINPPYRLDPFQNIVNVNLGGLAVEFLDGAA